MEWLTFLRCAFFLMATTISTHHTSATFPGTACSDVSLDLDGGVTSITTAGSVPFSLREDSANFCWSIQSPNGTLVKATFRYVENLPGEITLSTVDLRSASEDPLTPGPRKPNAMFATFTRLGLIASVPKTSNATFSSDIEAVSAEVLPTCRPSEHLCEHGASFCVDEDVSCLCLRNLAADCGIDGPFTECIAVDLDNTTVFEDYGEMGNPLPSWDEDIPANTTCWIITGPYGKTIKAAFAFPSGNPRIVAAQPGVTEPMESILNTDAIPNSVFSLRSSIAFIVGEDGNGTGNTEFRFSAEVVDDYLETCAQSDFSCSDSSYVICFDGSVKCNSRRDCLSTLYSSNEDLGCDFCGPSILCLNETQSLAIEYPWFPQEVNGKCVVTGLVNCTWWIYAEQDKKIRIDFNRFEPYISKPTVALRVGIPDSGDYGDTLKTYEKIREASLLVNGSQAWIGLEGDNETMLLLTVSAMDPVPCDEEDMFLCHSGLSCINQSLVCSGFPECDDKSDEFGCGYCSDDRMHCGYGSYSCSREIYICDGTFYCSSSWYDELNCGYCGPSLVPLDPDAPVHLSSPVISPGSDTVSCIWLLQASPGYKILIRVIRFAVSTITNYVAIGNGHKPGGPSPKIIEKNVGALPRALVSESDKAWVKFYYGSGRGHGETNFFEFELTEFNQTVDCGAGHFRCAYGLQCVPDDVRCDTVRDCDDFSDEIGCDCVGYYSIFPCGDGSCVSIGEVCNGRAKCKNALDETDCYSFCGSRFINLTVGDEARIHLPVPAFYPYFCGWWVTSETNSSIYVDIVAMQKRYVHSVWFSSQPNFDSASALKLDTSDRLPGTTYFTPGGEVYIASWGYADSELPTELELLIRVQQESGICRDDQVLFDNNICLSQQCLCDGKANLKDYSDEFNCSTCGTFDIELSVENPVSLEIEFDDESNEGVLSVYHHTSNGPPTLVDSVGPVESLGRLDCIWRVTAPPGTRIEISVSEFSNALQGTDLRIDDGDFPVGVRTVRTVQSTYPISGITYFSGSNLWVLLMYEGTGFLRKMKVVFTTYVIAECSVEEYRCPISMECHDSSAYCNGFVDCPLHGDELGCGECYYNEIECTPNGKCIPESYICDTIADCDAFNDEYNCTTCADTSVINLTSTSVYNLDFIKTIDCAWVVYSPPSTRIRVTMLGPTGCILRFGEGLYTRFSNSTVAFRTVDPTLVQHIVYPNSLSTSGPSLWITGKCYGPTFNYAYKLQLEAFKNKDCSPTQRLCPSGSKCVEPSAFCNSKIECPEYDDEFGCGICGPNEFACLLRGGCVDTNSLCNGIEDCEDGSDEFNCGPCGANYFNLTEDMPAINSPGWPNDYPDSIQCVYLLEAALNQRVVVIFESFDTEEGFDKLVMGDGLILEKNVILELSGKNFPSRVASNQYTMYLTFTSDYLINFAGFSLRVEQQPSDEVSCGAGEIQCDYRAFICVSENNEEACPDLECDSDVITSTESTVDVKSPNYPKSYPANLYCKWDISSRGGDPATKVEIVDFFTESGKDVVRLSSTFLIGEQTFILSGSTKIQSILFNSTEIVVRFETDSTIGLSGFYLQFTNVNMENDSDWCSDEDNGFKCQDGACLLSSAKCDGFFDCLRGEDEDSCASVYCPEFYHCSGTKTCIMWEYVCDGIVDCHRGDDEIQCDEKRCPANCSCAYVGEDFHVHCNNGWGPENIRDIARKTTTLELSKAENGNTTLLLLPGLFKGFPFLRSLSLPYNMLRTIPQGTFYGLRNLTYLNISGNEFTEIEANTFAELENLEALVIMGVPGLQKIEEDAFFGLGNLKTLVFVRDVTDGVPLIVEKRAFSSLPAFTKTVVDDYRMCCNLLRDISGFQVSNCQTTQAQPPLNLCGSLMQNYGLRVCMWILGLSALFGNLVVIIWRLQNTEGSSGKKTHSFMVLNLAVSDFIMGVYMLIIAAADIHYGESYSMQAAQWRSSITCKLAGILSVLSSEASVFFVTLISLDCFFCIVLPFSRIRLREWSVRIVTLVAWLLIVCLSVIPTLVVDTDSDFYGLSDVCIGLPLTTKAAGVQLQPSDIDNPFGNDDTLQIVSSTGSKPAWIFSIVVFLGINLSCFLVVFCCYAAIFVKVKRSVLKVKKNSFRDREIKMAIKMALIVGTDFACWMPVIVVGILSQTGAVHVGAEVYSWIVVLVLPINSSLNPYLYTIYSVIVDRRNAKYFADRSLNQAKKPKSGSIETVNSYLSDSQRK